MPTTSAELRARIGHRVRVKIAQPNTPTQPFIERDAVLNRIDEPNRFAYFTIGVFSQKVSWDDVESLEGGVGPPLDQGVSHGTAF